MQNVIAITTLNRPTNLSVCLCQISLFKQPNEVVFVYDDGSTPEKAILNKHLCSEYRYVYQYSENKGIAYAKNKCLEFAKSIGANNVVLLDDDCFVIKSFYFEYLSQIAIKYNENYFVLLDGNDFITGEKNKVINFVETDEIKAFAKTYGVMQFITKKVLNSGLQFNTEFKSYGSEHILFMFEVANLGLSKLGTNLQPTNLKDYFHSIDLHGDFYNLKSVNETSIDKSKKDYYSQKNHILLNKKISKLKNLNFNSKIKGD